VVAAPTGLAATVTGSNKKGASVAQSWADNSANEAGFLIQRADDAGFNLGVVNTNVLANVKSLTQSVSRGKTYHYRVLAFSDTTQSGWSNKVSVTTP
jgi:hypothetical protein